MGGQQSVAKPKKKSSKKKSKPTRKVLGKHIEIFNVKDDPDLSDFLKKEYEKLVDGMKYWTDVELQRKQIGSMDDYGPLNLLNILDEVVIYDSKGVKFKDLDNEDDLDMFEFLEENGWFDRMGRYTGGDFPYDNLNSMMKVLKIINPRQYVYGAALFENLAGRGSERIIYDGEKAIKEWVDSKGKVEEKKRPKFLQEGAKRPSPTASATSVEENTVAIGNDDNFYVSKKDKSGKQTWKRITNL